MELPPRTDRVASTATESVADWIARYFELDGKPATAYVLSLRAGEDRGKETSEDEVLAVLNANLNKYAMNPGHVWDLI